MDFTAYDGRSSSRPSPAPLVRLMGGALDTAALALRQRRRPAQPGCSAGAWAT